MGGGRARNLTGTCSGPSNTAMIEFAEDVVRLDGRSAHLEGVLVLEIKNGRFVRGRDYLFDQATFESLWGGKQRAA